MEYFFAEPDRVKHLIENQRLRVFLDYDGTLTPIAQRPEDAILATETKMLVKDLSQHKKCEITIVSGRALSDIKKLAGLKNITYVGNHGMEIEGQNLTYRHPVPPGYKNDLKQISTALHQALAEINGAIIETKGYSTSLHYRLVDPKVTPLVKKVFEKIVAAYVQRKRISVRDGKMLLEIWPPVDWNKGKAVLWLLEKLYSSGQKANILSVYIGDDLTDEDAFVALKNKGLTIVVGQPEHSCAQYYLNDTAEVTEFLRQILNFIKD